MAEVALHLALTHLGDDMGTVIETKKQGTNIPKSKE